MKTPKHIELDFFRNPGFGNKQAKKFTSGMKFDRKFMIIVTADNDVHVSCLKVKNVAFLTCNGCSSWRILDDKSNM